MRDTDNMIDIREGKFEKLVHDNTAGIRKSKERMVGKAGFEAHGAGMDDGFVTHGGKRLVSMDDGYPFSKDDGSKYGKESVEGGRGGGLEDDQHGDMVDLETVG